MPALQTLSWRWFTAGILAWSTVYGFLVAMFVFQFPALHRWSPLIGVLCMPLFLAFLFWRIWRNDEYFRHCMEKF